MSKVNAINIIVKKKNQLRKYKEIGISFIETDDIYEWLNNIHLELTDK